EVTSGAVTLPANDGGTIDNTDMEWKVESSQRDDIANLWDVTVTVTRKGSGDHEDTFSMSQMVFDPAQRGSSFDVAASAASSTASGSGSTGGTSSSGGSSSSGSGGNTQTPGAGTAGTSKTPSSGNTGSGSSKTGSGSG